ncbi:unnamed protein product [Lupinus luteus]|uniref:Uncharacterized protein n=1 Tax=Lupinus luteus TaxID=3873 RepID=A0AAV1YEW6_LUPLU
MAEDYRFTLEEMAVNENLGYPKAYAKICRDRGFSPYSNGPPFTFIPYALHEDEAARAKDLDQMFPLIDPKAKPTNNPKIFVSILWKHLSHLGNAGFDPAESKFRKFLLELQFSYFACIPASRVVGYKVFARLKILPIKDTLDDDVVVGENQELNASQIVDSHSFPQHFFRLKEEVGLAPAAIVDTRREPYDALALRQLDYNKKPRPMSPAIVAARKRNGNILKENEDPEFVKNPYQAIVMARDSLKQRDETTKMQREIHKLDDEVNEMKLKNEEEKLIIQDLESALVKRKRKAEKCRRLAEAQSSYRTTLEKMIRDTMHQSVIYKEQIRLNQAASNTLMARLEAQRATCDAAEKELHKKYKQKDDIVKQLRPEWEQGRKRSRIEDYSTFEERDKCKPILYLPGMRPSSSLHKELRMFLEEEQKVPEDNLPANEEEKQEEKEEKPKFREEKLDEEHDSTLVNLDDENSIEQRLEKLEITEEKWDYGASFLFHNETETEEDEETRKQRGKGNVDKWLQMLLGDSQEGMGLQEAKENAYCRTEEIIQQLNMKFPQKEFKNSKVSGTTECKEKKLQLLRDKNGWMEKEDRIENEPRSVMPTENKSNCEEARIAAIQIVHFHS